MELWRNVLPPVRRRRWMILATIGMVTGPLAVLSIAARDEDPPTREVPFMVPVPVTIPSRPPPPVIELVPVRMAEPSPPRCPAPVRTAPIVDPARLPVHIEHVRAAPTNASWIATWNADAAFVSRDAGATFHRVLDGDGLIRDVTFDCFGDVLVLRDDRLGVRDAAGDHWNVVPGFRPADEGDARALIAGGGPDAVVVGVDRDGAAQVAISHDRGTTWHYLDSRRETVAIFEHPRDAEQDADGTIRAWGILGDCMDDDVVTVIVRGDRITTTMAGIAEAAPFEMWGDAKITEDSRGTVWWRGERTPVPITGLAPAATPVLVHGALPTLVIGPAAYRFGNGAAHLLPVVVDGEAATVDLAGRIWSIDCGELKLARRASHAASCSGD